MFGPFFTSYLSVCSKDTNSCSLDQVLWPDCGWQPVSLTDLITGASVKKVYRKATLCIHPDKVQQKGATLQQKYIAEKVFDLLKVLVKYILLYGNFPFLLSPIRNAYLQFGLVLSTKHDQ